LNCGDGVDVAFDAVGFTDTRRFTLASAAPGGRLVAGDPAIKVLLMPDPSVMPD
jgi:NADPH:quinone reductase-like Zn-dependent oxidoreductase